MEGCKMLFYVPPPDKLIIRIVEQQMDT